MNKDTRLFKLSIIWWSAFLLYLCVVVHVSAVEVQPITKEWRITKTGSDILIDVSYEFINSTATIFYLRYYDYQLYHLVEPLEKKYLDYIPISKLSGHDFSFNKNFLSKNKVLTGIESVIVHHPINIEGIKFKIGFESIEVDGTGYSTATANPPMRNVVVDSNGKLHAAWTSGGADLWYGNSTDNGTTWTTKEISAGSYTYVNIMINSTDGLIIASAVSGADIKGFSSTDYGASWSSIFTIADLGTSITLPVCRMDGNDIYHCVGMETGSDYAYYVNSSTLDSETAVNSNAADDSDFCSIDVDSSNNPYVVCVGSDHDDIDIWSPALNGWGDANRVEIHSSTADKNPDIAIDSDDNIFVVWSESNDLWFANSTDGGSTWSTQEVDADDGGNPAVITNGDGNIFITYGSTTDNSGYVYYINSSDYGLNWSTRSQIATQSGYCSPQENNLENILHMLMTDSGSDVMYYNLTVPYTSCTANWTNTSWSSWINISCLPSDTMNQSRNLTQYDSNSCAGSSNTTFIEYQNVSSCDYCTPSMTNTSWTAWLNLSCVSGDLMNQSRNRTEYDSNACGEISNTTYYEYQLNGTCDFCVSNITNTSWSNWTNITCLNSNFMNMSRFLTQYDVNACADYTNVTFYEYRANETCVQPGGEGDGSSGGAFSSWPLPIEQSEVSIFEYLSYIIKNYFWYSFVLILFLMLCIYVAGEYVGVFR